jgi:hypothetical protein
MIFFSKLINDLKQGFLRFGLGEKIKQGAVPFEVQN